MSPLKHFFIVGSQKCGTTYLHDCLVQTGFFSQGSQKEMHFFNQEQKHIDENFDNYMDDFKSRLKSEKALYFIDSSTSYFQLRRNGNAVKNNAKHIHQYFPDSPQIALFRNPIDRYESAFNHHVLWDRIPYQETIHEVNDDFRMLSLGEYSSILKYWRQYCPQLSVYLYDDLLLDSVQFVNDILQNFGVSHLVSASDIEFRSNDSSIKLKKTGVARKAKLSVDAKNTLINHYKPFINELEEMINRDLSSWLEI